MGMYGNPSDTRLTCESPVVSLIHSFGKLERSKSIEGTVYSDPWF